MAGYDVLIIGGGQAGIPLAWALAGKGKRVALAERKWLGGSCVNFGCTPTKAAIASSSLAHQARRAKEFGLKIPNVEVDFAAVLARARGIAENSRHGLEKALAGSENPKLLKGHARFTGSGFQLDVGGQAVTAKEVVINTGTRSLIPEGLPVRDPLHSGNWLYREELPRHLAILGGGYIALEMAQFYRRMGSEVTVIERSGQILGHEDADVAQALQEMVAGEGVNFLLNTDVEALRGIHYSHLFVATGRTPNTDDLGLETVGVRTVKAGNIEHDTRLATNVPGIWVAGDVRGGPLFTHTSWDDYRILLSQMAGDGSRTTDRIVPYAVFTDPELGRVGLTEADAKKQGRNVQVRRFEMKRNGKATEIGEPRGFIKVLTDPATDELIGAALLCAQAAELVHLFVDVMNAKGKASAIRDAIHIHPTLAEAVQSAVT